MEMASWIKVTSCWNLNVVCASAPQSHHPICIWFLQCRRDHLMNSECNTSDWKKWKWIIASLRKLIARLQVTLKYAAINKLQVCETCLLHMLISNQQYCPLSVVYWHPNVSVTFPGKVAINKVVVWNGTHFSSPHNQQLRNVICFHCLGMNIFSWICCHINGNALHLVNCSSAHQEDIT